MSDSWDEDAEGGSFGELIRQIGDTPEAAPPQIPAGTRIAEHYEVIRQLGAGGMGIVVLATDVRLGRPVALKLHNVEPSDAARERSMREATAMARLQHPNVVAVHDVGHADDGRLFIAMEYVEGVTVRQWLAEKPRLGPEIIELFLQAARGLAAAHEGGLVHRDIKPDNLLVGNDGRVRVADFGLARRRGDPPVGSTDPFAKLPDLASLSRSGRFAGTPAYASPEQLRGESLDARSDQFSLCASLYEALYGGPPFEGRTAEELIGNVRERKVRAEERAFAPKTPAGARAVLMRGLSMDPEERFEDLTSLIDELEALFIRRRWPLVAAATVGLAAVGGFFLLDDPCAAATPLEQAWASSRAAARAALIGALPESGEAQRTVEELERYVERWSGSYRRSCREGGRSAQAVRRQLCLAHRARVASAFVQSLPSANGERAKRALRNAYELPSVALCDDPRYLIAIAPAPSSLEAAQRVESFRERLASVAAELDGGDFEAGRTKATSELEAAALLGYPPAEAEAAALLGRAQEMSGNFGQAREALERAYFVAVEAGHDVIAVETATSLIYLLSFHMSKATDALEWGRHAKAVVRRLGIEGALLGRLRMNMSTAYGRASQDDKAVEASQSALDALQKAKLENDAVYVVALTRHGSALADANQYQKAVATLERAVALAERIFGERHRALHRPLAELGQALSHIGQVKRAIEIQERAVSICAESFGPKHVNTGFAELNLGVAHFYAGTFKKARVHFGRSVEIVEAALGPNHRDTALCLSNLALTMDDEPEEAVKIHRRLIGIFSRQGETHVDVAMARINLSNNLYKMKAYEEAAKEARLSIEIWEKIGSVGVRAAFAYHLLGISLARLGRSKEAVAPLTRAVALRESEDAAPKFLCDSLYELARALDSQDRARATKLAKRARKIAKTLPMMGPERIKAIDEWLSRR